MRKIPRSAMAGIWACSLALFQSATQRAWSREVASGDAAVISSSRVLTFEKLFSSFQADKVPCDLGPMGPWMESETCGLNCAFMMLKLAGLEVSYDDLSRAAGPMPAGGLSLAEIQDLCGKFRLNCDIVKCNFEQIRSMKPPLIVHLGETDKPGHYVCLADRATSGPSPSANFVFVDGTTAAVSYVPGSALEISMRDISGFILVPRTTSWDRWGGTVESFLGIMFFLLVVDHAVWTRRRSNGATTP